WLLFSVAVMDACDESSFVRITELHLVDRDGTFLGRRALRAFENKTSAVADGDGFNISGHGIFDRFERDPEIVAKPCAAFEPIHRDAERNELRVQLRAESCRQNFKRQSTGLTRTDLEQGFSLFLGRPLIDKQTDGAIALVNRTRPLRGERETESIEC